MRRRTKQVLPAGLERARQQFERWRGRRRAGRRRIPEALWATAATAAGRFGLHRTSRVLRLDYVVLKRHVGAGRARGLSRKETAPGFVELLPAGGYGQGTECVLEVEEPSGARLRIELKRVVPPDVVALTRSLRVGGA